MGASKGRNDDVDVPGRSPISSGAISSGMGGWISKNLTERRAVIFIIGLFLVMSVLISSVPYDPETDLADAVTNDIWVEYYSQGIFSIPYDDWSYGNTQSVVVWHDGQYVVVNEKGPGHVLMMVPLYLLGADFLFGSLMAGIAVLATYMLGKRLFNWRVGAIAAVLVLTNVSVIMMWYRYYWTDASTMSLLALSIWLCVEANYWINGRSLDPKNINVATVKEKLLAIGLGVLAGLSFGASVSTRYATALLLIPILLYFVLFYLIRAWPSLRNRRIYDVIRSSFNMWPLIAVFVLGLACVLVPLMSYNSEYFGGPLQSGFDATTLQQFSRLGNTTERDTSSAWISSSSDNLSTVASNFFVLLPVLIARMPFLLLAPFGIWMIRRRFPALSLMTLWIAVNFYTYLSISWVSMYATMPAGILYEPRYFIPSIPAMALLAGIVIDRMAFRTTWWKTIKNEFRFEGITSRKITLAAMLVAVMVLCGLVPAAAFFSESSQAGDRGPPQGQPLGPNGSQSDGNVNPDDGPTPSKVRSDLSGNSVILEVGHINLETGTNMTN